MFCYFLPTLPADEIQKIITSSDRSSSLQCSAGCEQSCRIWQRSSQKWVQDTANATTGEVWAARWQCMWQFLVHYSKIRSIDRLPEDVQPKQTMKHIRALNIPCEQQGEWQPPQATREERQQGRRLRLCSTRRCIAVRKQPLFFRWRDWTKSSTCQWARGSLCPSSDQ